MNIAFFTNAYLPIKGGVTTSILCHKKYLESQGHECYVFAPEFKDYKDDDPHVFRYPSFHWRAKGIDYPVTFFDNRKIREKFANLNIDIIHTQHPYIYGRIARKYSKIFKKPLIFTYHSQYKHYVHYLPLPKFLEKIAGNIAENSAISFAQKCDKVIVVGQAMKEFLDKQGLQEKTVFIPTGVDFDHFNRDYQNSQDLRGELGIQQGDVVIVHVGRLNQEKNFEFLYKAVSQVLKENKQIKFIIVGPGMMLDYYKAQVKLDKLEDQVKITGPIDWNLVPNYMALGDIFVFASKTETQGLVINEAQAMGLPVVAIKAGGVEDAMVHNKTGFLLEENEQEFQFKIEELVKNEELRQNMSKAAVNNAKNYSQEKIGKKLMILYQQVIDNYRSG